MSLTKQVKLAVCLLLITGLTVTQAVPLSDAQLVAKPESKGKAQAIVAPADPSSAQIQAHEPDTKDPKNMAPLPCCQQSAILSIQAVVPNYALDKEKANADFITNHIWTSEIQTVRFLPHSRASVHTELALQATLVGAYPSGTS